MAKFIDLTGQTFGRLQVIERAPNSKFGEARWICRCACKQITIVVSSCLHNGKVRSCGCLQKESVTIHGMSRTPIYKSWDSMISRCTNPNDPSYVDYGGRGIRVCDRWRFGDGTQGGFECFLADMGERPPGTTLDRIDNDWNYEPGNCRWMSPSGQANNRRNNRNIIFQGETNTIAQWARRARINRSVLRGRLDRGWSIERALSAPVEQQKRRESENP